MYAVVKLAPGADVDGVARELRRRLPFNDVYTKDAWAVRTRDYWVKSTGLGMGMWATTFLGCLIGVVVVAQTLYAATLEHLREFGTVKAIGGTNRDIYLILLKQAWTASVAGFAVGMATVLAIRAVVRRVGLDLQFGADLLAAVFAGTVIMCCAAAAVSFRKVASIDPAMLFRG
jgi:putative ABC transport system permease protein